MKKNLTRAPQNLPPALQNAVDNFFNKHNNRHKGFINQKINENKITLINLVTNNYSYT